MITARYNFEGFKVVIHNNGVEIFLAAHQYTSCDTHYSQEVVYENWDEVENSTDDGEDHDEA